MKLGMLGETIVNLIFIYDRIPLPLDNTAVKRIDILFREGMIPCDLVNILHALRKIRNKAVHENYSSVEDGKALIQMAHSLSEWFMQTYGDWNYLADKMQQIVDAEAPIMHDRLIKKTLRAFNIVRSGTQTLEATDRALKKVSVRINKQAGVKFYWRKDQDPNQYRVYRNDVRLGDKRSIDEICQQELKNAVCITLKEQGAMDKDSLLKTTIRTMGYARSSTALLAAAERGLRYGRKKMEE